MIPTYIKFTKLIKEFEINYPAYYNLKYNTQTASIKDIQIQLKNKKKSCLLEYIIIKNKLYSFLITESNFEIIKINLPNNFKDILEVYSEAISFIEFDDFHETSSNLYSYLIQPILSKLKGINKLIINKLNKQLTLFRKF